MNRTGQATLITKWQEFITDCQSSPSSIKNFARQRKIGVSSLYYWSKKLGVPLKNEPADAMQFIALNPFPQNLSIQPKETEVKPCLVEISINHLKIRTEASWMQVVELVKGLA